MVFSVAYDLRSQRDYSRIIEAIRSYDGAQNVLESLWVIRSNSSAAGIRDHLLNYVDGDDGLFVAKLTGEAAWRGVLCSSDKLKETL